MKINLEKLLQKLLGLALVILSIVTIQFDNDITLAVVFIPVGLILLLSKKQWLDF